MKRKFKLLFPVIAALFSLASCDFITIKDNENDGDNKQEEETPIVVDKTELEKYYEGVNLSRTGGRLMNELQSHMFKTHTQWVTYGQVNGYYSKTSTHESVEAVALGSKTNQWFYTGKQASGYGTREHVWPCANSDQLWTHSSTAPTSFTPHYVDWSYYTGGGSDLYHVRTCNSDVNTARGNGKFVDFDDPEMESLRNNTVSIGESNGKWEIKCAGCDKNSSTGKWEFADKVEPADEMKGDIARIVLYVYMHYTERGVTPEGSVTKSGHVYHYSDMTGALSLTQIMGYESEERCKEVLKAWNKLDAPSNVEKLRNDSVQKIQGNRNPFVDYPEIVDNLF